MYGKKVKLRAFFILLIFLSAILTIFLVIKALEENVVYFKSPSEIQGITGGFFGSHLHDVGENVTFLVREKKKLVIEKKGIEITPLIQTSKQSTKLERDLILFQRDPTVILSNFKFIGYFGI